MGGIQYLDFVLEDYDTAAEERANVSLVEPINVEWPLATYAHFKPEERVAIVGYHLETHKINWELLLSLHRSLDSTHQNMDLLNPEFRLVPHSNIWRAASTAIFETTILPHIEECPLWP